LDLKHQKSCVYYWTAPSKETISLPGSNPNPRYERQFFKLSSCDAPKVVPFPKCVDGLQLLLQRRVHQSAQRRVTNTAFRKLDVSLRIMTSSFADPGCLSRIPDPTFFHPGYRIQTVSIPDPGSASKNLCILTPKKPKKWLLSSRKYDPSCSSRIRMLTFYPSRIPDPGLKKAPDPGSG
jgi:hypothetical protein